MWKGPELYRGKYYARKGSGNATKRRSLKTTELDVAIRRLEDLRRFDQEEPKLIKDIYQMYATEKENKYNSLDYLWRKLEPTFGVLRPDQVTKNLCKRYIEERKAANNTVLRELGALRTALNWFDKNNVAEFEFPQAGQPKDRYLTRTEAKKLYDSAIEPHIRLFIILAIGTAARKSALLELTWDRVDFERGLINLGTGDGNKKRAIVPMNTTCEHALEHAYKVSMSENVIEYKGKPVKNVRKGIQSASERAKLKDVTTHTLRHTAAVWMAENRIPMSEIAQYLGHTNTRVTEQVYARYSPDYLRQASRSLEVCSFEHGDTTYYDA